MNKLREGGPSPPQRLGSAPKAGGFLADAASPALKAIFKAVSFPSLLTESTLAPASTSLGNSSGWLWTAVQVAALSSEVRAP